ncbi:hypothetical protein AeMF1_006631 [Aphanomyces euteiches]|nr:hypothetical protein AeMF1_020172 [Aphanomyces euteiches]KAH9114927.1 hypothetical protein AeMF1_011031 [Aphanomyces euteiches]KAH9121785.1 hypothetical protein AeMF1_006631 [Aphanomyces euteiches]
MPSLYQVIAYIFFRRKVCRRRQLVLMNYLIYHYIAYVHKTLKHVSILSGPMFVQEILNGNPTVMLDNFRMPRRIFDALANDLERFGALKSSKHVSVQEQLGIFLYFVGHHASNAALQSRFQRSGETITRHVRRVLAALVSLAPRYIKIPDDNSPVPSQIASNPKYYPFFQFCRMAIDGTHIPVWVPEKAVAKFRGRKGVTMNVLAACDFDMCFTYVLAGWEGTAGDGKVYADALTKGLTLSRNMYDLADCGFGLTLKALTPYRELFNLRHAKLRNVVERIFGVLKKRFPVLNSPVDYGFQVDLVLALCAIHNFIRMNGSLHDVFTREAIGELRERNQQPMESTDHQVVTDEPENEEAKSWRDAIATEMWSQYMETLRQRRFNRN